MPCICGHNAFTHGVLGCRECGYIACPRYAEVGTGLTGVDAEAGRQFEDLSCTRCNHPAARHTGADRACDVRGCGCRELEMSDYDWRIFNAAPPMQEELCQHGYRAAAHSLSPETNRFACSCDHFRVRDFRIRGAGHSLRTCSRCGHTSHVGRECRVPMCNCYTNHLFGAAAAQQIPSPPPPAKVSFRGQPPDQGLITVGIGVYGEGYAEIRCGNTVVKIGYTELQRATGGISGEFEQALYAITAEAMLGRTPHHRTEPRERPERKVDLTPLRDNM